MRFLIIKTSAFGDVVQAYPVLHYLKKLHPDAQIDWVVEKKIASLVSSHPQVTRTIEINAKEWKKALFSFSTFKEAFRFIKELRKESYDAVFDLQGNSKSALVTFFSKSKAKVGFGWKTASERLNCWVTKYRANPPKGQNARREYLYVVQNYFKDFSALPCEKVELLLSQDEKNTVDELRKRLAPNPWMICPGSQWINKKLPLEDLKSLLQQAFEKFKPSYVFIAGSSGELQEAEMLASFFPNTLILNKLSLPALQHMMKSMELVISMDSLPLHLAATTDVKTFSLFGPSVSYKYRPVGESHFSFQGSCPYGLQFERRCPKLRTCPTGACIRKASPEDIFSSLQAWWSAQTR
jgi:heptosyltransferase I